MNPDIIPSNERLESIASILEADLTSMQQAIGAALGGVANARFLVAGDEGQNKKSGAVTYVPHPKKFRGPCLSFYCHRSGRQWTEELYRPQGFSSERPDFQEWDDAQRQACEQAASRLARQLETAQLIAKEGRRRPLNGSFRNYFADKGMMRWEGARYTARRYGWRAAEGKEVFLSPGLPFWMGTNCVTGEVQCVQAKYWNSKAGKFAVVTCGPTKGAQVEFLPSANVTNPDGVPVILCEGVSTAWALLQLLGGHAHVIATLGKGNLRRCAIAARGRFGEARPLFIMADIDANGAGQAAAFNAADESGAVALLPLERTSSAEELVSVFATAIRDSGGNWDAWDLWRRTAAIEAKMKALHGSQSGICLFTQSFARMEEVAMQVLPVSNREQLQEHYRKRAAAHE